MHGRRHRARAADGLRQPADPPVLARARSSRRASSSRPPLAALIIVLPRDPVEITAPVEFLLPFLMLATFIALRLFGKGTEAAPDTLINLGPIQPSRSLKLVLRALPRAAHFGRRAASSASSATASWGRLSRAKKILIPGRADPGPPLRRAS
mgnify:CR=1 FL=1